jgi:hypothetical protein
LGGAPSIWFPQQLNPDVQPSVHPEFREAEIDRPRVGIPAEIPEPEPVTVAVTGGSEQWQGQ